MSDHDESARAGSPGEPDEAPEEVDAQDVEELRDSRAPSLAPPKPVAGASLDMLLSDLDADLATALEKNEPPLAPGIGLPGRPRETAGSKATIPGGVRSPAPRAGKPASLPPPPAPSRKPASLPPPPGRPVAAPPEKPAPRATPGEKGAPTTAASPPAPRATPGEKGASTTAASPPAPRATPPERKGSPTPAEGAPRSAPTEKQGAPIPPPLPAARAESPAEDPRESSARAAIDELERELSRTRDPARQARIHFEIAKLAELELGDHRRAGVHYHEALSRSPENTAAARGARRVLLARKNYQAALPLFDAEARLTADPRVKAALYFAKGRVLEDAIGQKGEARQQYATAAELDRTSPVILQALEHCDQDAGNHNELARTLERLANAISSDPVHTPGAPPPAQRHRAALTIARARLLETKSNASEAAIELYESALRLDPAAEVALEALKRLHHQRRRWRDLISVLAREAELSSDPKVRAMALYRIARLYSERLGQRDDAIAALEHAVGQSPREPLVLDELARLYEAAERWEPLAAVLERRVEVQPDPTARLTLLLRVGQLREDRLGDPAAALSAYEAALSIAPAHLPTLSALSKLYARSGDWLRLIAMHAGEAEHALDAKRRAAAHARIAEIHEISLDQPDQAIEHHARALSLVPAYPPSLAALMRLYTEAGRWRELVDLHSRAADQASEPERAIAHLMRIGAIYEDHLEEPAQAAHAYKRVLTIEPAGSAKGAAATRPAAHIAAIQALQRAHERAGRHDELAAALEMEAELSRDPKQVVALLHRAGDVLDELVGDRESAIALLRKVLTTDPSYLPALESLARIHHRAQRWEDLLELYKRELELTLAARPGETSDGAIGPRQTAVALLLKMGELCAEQIGRDDEALSYLRRAAEIDPTSGPALLALSRKLRDRSNWEELVRVMELELAASPDSPARARAAYRLGEVLEERLGQLDRAASAYEQARDAEPGYRPPVDGLARIRADKGAFRKLAEELERDSASSPDPRLQIAALMRAGDLWTDPLNEPRRAVTAYEQVLEREPGHPGAMLALESLYRRLASFDALARLYANEARTLTDRDARAAALLELARVREARLGAPVEEVREIYKTALALVPDEPIAIMALERIAIAERDRPLLLDIDRRIAAHAGDPRTASVYRARLAESLEQAGRRQEAMAEHRAALEADPESLAAVRGLSRLAEAIDDPVALAEASRHRARITEDPASAARFMVRAGVVTHERLGDHQAALADYERALELWPDDVEAASRLQALMLASGEASRTADRLARAAQSAKSAERAAELWNEVARLQADLLENVPGAIAALQRVLKSTPGHVPTLRRSSELHERIQQWNETAQLLAKVIQLAPDRDTIKDAHLRLAALYDARLGEPARALVSLQAALAVDPEHRGALGQLAALHTKMGDLDKAADAAERQVRASSVPAERAQALLEQARIEISRGREEAAARALTESIALAGPGCEAAREHKSLPDSRSPAGIERYAGALREYLSRADAERRAASIELAALLGDSLGRDEESASVLRDAQRAFPGDVEIDRLLASRLLRVGRGEEATTILRKRIDESPARAECWRDLRTVWNHTRPDRVALTLPPLALLGAATGEELERLSARPNRAAQARPGSLSLESGALPALYELDLSSPLMAVLATLPEVLPKVVPADLSAYSVSSRDKLMPRSGHPLRVLADRVAAIFKVEQLDLYIHRARGRNVAIELTDPISILLPGWISELGEPGQVFLLARALANVAMRLPIADKLTPREIEVLVASAVRPWAPGFGSGLTSEDVLEDQARKIGRALPRRARKPLEDAAARYVSGPPVDFVAWSRAVQMGSARAALLTCDDLIAGVDVLRRTERDLMQLAPRDLVLGSQLVADLVRFWISDFAADLRARTGA